MPAFLFPGQGSLKPGMLRAFYDGCPVSREVLESAASRLPAGLMDILLHGDPKTLQQTLHAQPALLCLALAITACLRSHGVFPDRCAGHSVGEIGALAVSGALEPGHAIALILARARIMTDHMPAGGMAAVFGLEPAEIEALLPDSVEIACYNGPRQIIIAGVFPSLEEAGHRLRIAGAARVQPLAVSGPFHTRFMRPAADLFAACLERIPLDAPAIPFVSSVSGAYEDDPARIRKLLVSQFCEPVRWTHVMPAISGGVSLEIGSPVIFREGPKNASSPVADSPEACAFIARQIKE